MENTIEGIGLYLKEIREERKIPITQIARALKARIEAIQELEANDFGKFPAPTYVKGYLRSYAVYLGLDPDPIIAQYNKQHPDKSQQVLVLQSKEMPKFGFGIKNIITPKLLLSAVGVIALILIVVIIVLFWPQKQTSTITIQQEIEEILPPQKVIPPMPSNIEITLPISMLAKTKDNVWLRVHADTKLVFEGILDKGDEETWQAEKEFKIRIGNPAMLDLTINGQSVGSVSPYGPVNVVINESGITTEK